MFTIYQGIGVKKIINNVGFGGWQRGVGGPEVFAQLVKMYALHGY